MKKLAFLLLFAVGTAYLLPQYSYAHDLPISNAVLLGHEEDIDMHMEAKNGFTKFMQLIKNAFSKTKDVNQNANSARVSGALDTNTVLPELPASAVGTQEFSSFNHDILLNGLNYKTKSIFGTKKLKEVSKANIYTLLTERKKKLLSMVKTNPGAVGAYALPLFTKTLLPDGTEGLYEAPVELEGAITIFHGDDFKTGKATYQYTFVKGKKRYEFYPTPDSNIVAGQGLIVTGYILDNILVGRIDQGSIERMMSKNSLPPDSPLAPVNKRVLALLIKFTDSPADPFTATQAQDLIFNGQFQNFYTEQSYSKVYFVGDVRGWYTLPHPSNNCDPETFGTDWTGTPGELDSIISVNAINLSQYDQVVIVSNCAGSYNKGYSTIGPEYRSVNGENYYLSVAWAQSSGTAFTSPSWSQSTPTPFAWSNLDFLLSHEVGHGFTLLHPYAYDCGSKTITTKTFGLDSTCAPLELSEYANRFDVMGYGEASGLHINAFYKELLGWLSSTNTITATTSGSYTLSKYEGGTGKKMLKIQKYGTTLTPYYIEWRTGFGFDGGMNDAAIASNKNGLIITRPDSDSHTPPFYLDRLLDIRPTTAVWQEDTKGVSLNGTKVFVDARSGISIGPITAKANGLITFNVAVDPVTCIHNVPMFRFAEGYALSVGTGDQFVLWPTLYNDDYTGCAPVTMTITMTLPAGFTASPLVTTMNNFAPETAQQISLPVVTASESLAPGVYYISLKGRNVPANKSVTIQVPITVTN